MIASPTIRIPRSRHKKATSPGDFPEASITSNGPKVPPTSNVPSNAVSWLRAWSEPSRDCRRLQLLRGWSYDKENIGKIFP